MPYERKADFNHENPNLGQIVESYPLSLELVTLLSKSLFSPFLQCNVIAQNADWLHLILK